MSAPGLPDVGRAFCVGVTMAAGRFIYVLALMAPFYLFSRIVSALAGRVR